MRKKYNVNLLLKKPKKLGEDIIYFLLHYFRYILVITQIVIIIVFFYRLKVDQEIVDLNDTLRQQQEILQALKPFVTDIKEKHERYEYISSIIRRQKNFKEELNYFLSVFPANFYLSKLSIKEGKISMSGKSLDYLTIMRFLNRVKKDLKFRQVHLTSVEKQGGFFVFQIELSNFKFN